jgi:hypothetical protein
MNPPVYEDYRLFDASLLKASAGRQRGMPNFRAEEDVMQHCHAK